MAFSLRVPHSLRPCKQVFAQKDFLGYLVKYFGWNGVAVYLTLNWNCIWWMENKIQEMVIGIAMFLSWNSIILFMEQYDFSNFVVKNCFLVVLKRRKMTSCLWEDDFHNIGLLKQSRILYSTSSIFLFHSTKHGGLNLYWVLFLLITSQFGWVTEKGFLLL